MAVRLISAISAALLLFAPMAAAAQQFTLDPAVLQQFAQLQLQSTSTVSSQLQQNILQFLPIAQTYLQNLNPTNDTEAIIQRLETMLTDPKFQIATYSLASTTLQALAAGTSTNQALIGSLLGQVAVLQAQINAILAGQATSTATSTLPLIEFPEPGAAAGVCPAIARLLQYGASGADVVQLQTFLINAGLLEAGNATGFFGRLTEAAVQAWQQLKAIVTEGDPATTGFGAVGPLTRAALQNCSQ